MSFTTSRMLGSEVLVRGTDVQGNTGKTVLDSTQWDEISQRTEFDQAEKAFAAAVEEFFAPLEEAAENLKKVGEKPTDPMSYVVLDEGVEGQAARPKTLVKLTKDSIILRLLEAGDTDRLEWLDESTLGVLEVAVQVPVNGQPSAAEVGAEATGLPLDEV